LATVREELLGYYERELTYMRQLGTEFAQKYPKLADRLLLEADHCDDPHVERLLQGFALLAARVHLKLNDDFPEISTAILETVYPHYVRPIPSMSVVEFELDPEQGKLTTGLKVPKGSVLHSHRVNGVQCKFRTSYESTVWPVEVAEASWRSSERHGPEVGRSVATAVLRLQLRCFPDVSFKSLEMTSLRFYLSGESSITNTLYELLFNNCISITLRDPDKGNDGRSITLPGSSLRAVGFGEDEGLIPYSRRSFLGYRLLQEYFTFPEKFMFVELNGLEALAAAGFGARAEISFNISRFERPERHHNLEQGVSAKTLRIGCTPIINLFPQIAEPIAVDQTRFEYPVVADARRLASTEIFSIDEVSAQNPRSRELVSYQPFYSFRHASDPAEGRAFWHIRRTTSEVNDDVPSQVYLSLADLTGASFVPDADVISVRCTCTNSSLPAKLPVGQPGGDFQLEGVSALRTISALRRPTPTIRPPLGRATLWNVISHLSLNYLSLLEEGKEPLQEVLRLYNFSDLPHLRNQIAGIRGINSKRHVGMVKSEVGVSLARGTRVEMEFDEDQFAGGGVFLFSSVLENFLGLYVSMNSFSQLVVSTTQRKEVMREWPPRAGNQILM
jgi:type VI secretion system protein ImpG